MNKKFDKLGFYPADILLPKGQDMNKWAVVACDQFTSEPEYWQAVEKKVGDAPSTLRLILPEANLKAPNVDEYIENINNAMKKYLADGVFETLTDSLIYIERQQSDGKIRHGLIGMVDLDAYDFTPGSGALIRATEGTVLDRIPPRAKVRRNAPIELPHVMLLIDDPDKTVIEPLTAAAEGMEKVYDFDLMQDGGHIRGFKLSDKQIDAVASVSGVAPLLFAVGDGNHSLATAKACYEEQKKGKTPEEYLALPARYALVEVVNNHDDALQFEPIHRVLFGVDHQKFMDAFRAAYPNAYEGKGDGHTIEFVWNGESHFITVPDPKVQLAVGTLQGVIDQYLKDNGGEVDYIHGDDVTRELGSKPGNMGFLLPAMGKEQLFKTVMADGVLPRKTFSMGHAQDKRYYIEARSRRPDGYHAVMSVMQRISLWDTVTVERGTGRDTLLCSVPVTESVDDNLCMKAARAFFAETGTKSDGVTITLEKHIPVQAGLGGGSSDAAAVLRALRTLYAPDISDGRLETLAARLGSDVPFFIRGGTQLATGRGEVVSPLPQLAAG